MAKAKCSCMPGNLGWFIVQSVFYALGAAGIVVGLQNVWVSGITVPAVVWAAAGFLIYTIGKLLKTKTHQNCPMYK